MAPRPSWTGYLKLGLLSVPVKAYTATSSEAELPLNQLHDECHNRIRYVKTCPVHGEVSRDEIVSGYEYAKGEYVVIDLAELQKLRPEGDKSITVDAFVADSAIDPIHYSGRTYYLVPDGPIGQKPYALLRQSMEDEGLHAVAKVVISQREQLVLLRPMEKLVGMTVLIYDDRIKKPSGFEDELAKTPASPAELKMMKLLTEALAQDDFDISAYHDLYTQRLSELIEAKVEGKELVSPPAAEEPHVINLMEALKASVKRAKANAKPAPAAKQTSAGARKPPPKKMAPSARQRTSPAKKVKALPRRKKSG